MTLLPRWEAEEKGGLEWKRVLERRWAGVV